MARTSLHKMAREFYGPTWNGRNLVGYSITIENNSISLIMHACAHQTNSIFVE